MGAAFKGKNLLPGNECFPLRADPMTKEENGILCEAISRKYIFFKYMLWACLALRI